MEKDFIEREFRALGTDIYLQLVDDDLDIEKAKSDLDEVQKIYKDKEQVLSRFNKKSELSKINNELGIFHQASEDILYLAQKCLVYYRESEGVFDPRILDVLEAIGYREDFVKNIFQEKYSSPDTDFFKNDLNKDLIVENSKIRFNQRMDFSGLAKGYITDRVADFLISKGWKNFLVDSGGDMYARGKNKSDRNWGISLEETMDEEEIMFQISNQGLATSGNTRKFWQMGEKRMHHLINPKNLNHFSFDIKTVTVVAESTELADVWAKVLFLLGPEEGIVWASKNNIECIFLKNNKDVIKSNLIS